MRLAGALREAFPLEVDGVYIAEEVQAMQAFAADDMSQAPTRGIEGVKARLGLPQPTEQVTIQAVQAETPEPIPVSREPSRIEPEPEFTLGKQPGDLVSAKKSIGATTTKAAARDAYRAEIENFAWDEQQEIELEAFANEHIGTLKK